MNKAGGPLICAVGESARERRRLNQGVRSGQYVRIAPGHYMETTVFGELDPEEQTIAGIVSHAGSAPTSVVVGRSAALLWGLPVTPGPALPVDLGTRAGRRHSNNRVRSRSLSVGHGAHVVSQDTDFGTVLVTDPLATALDLARWGSLQDAVRVLDHGLDSELFCMEEMDRRVAAMSGLKGIEQVRTAALLASTGSESPRESDIKLLMWDLGLPPPLQQVEITSRTGLWIGRVDYFFPEIGLIFEYDGQEKYLTGSDGGSARKELNQTAAYLANGLGIVRIRDEHVRSGRAAEIIAEHHAHFREIGRAYPEHLWNGGGPAWRCSPPGTNREIPPRISRR